MSGHGTNSRYVRGCRCGPCTAAHAEAHWRNTLAQRERAREDPALIPHGTTGGYRYWGCRCDPCASAASAACADWRQRRKAGTR